MPDIKDREELQEIMDWIGNLDLDTVTFDDGLKILTHLVRFRDNLKPVFEKYK